MSEYKKIINLIRKSLKGTEYSIKKIKANPIRQAKYK